MPPRYRQVAVGGQPTPTRFFSPKGNAASDPCSPTLRGFSFQHMGEWIKCEERRPEYGERVIVCFWWPDGEDYNMAQGCWPIDFEANGWGGGCLAVRWMPAPEYPNDLP